MSSDATELRTDEDNDSAEEGADGSCSMKNTRRKAPRRIMKAEREKLKREQLNELFSKLAGALELNEETYGKACILREAIKLVNDMLSDILCLKKDNAALLSESQYLTAEKNELKDENSALGAQVKNIQDDIYERVSPSNSVVNSIPVECWEPGNISSIPEASPSFQPVNPTFHQSPFLGPMYVIAANPDSQSYPMPASVTGLPPIISKPHARYPTSADTWALELLHK